MDTSYPSTYPSTDVSSTTLEAALESLAPRVLRYCRGRCGDPELAQEAAQEALTALVDRWRRLGPPTSAEGFTFTVARRRLSWALRKQWWKRRLGEPVGSLVHRDDGGASPERAALARDRLKRTHVALDRLKPRLRDALLLTAAAELDTATAANILGISPSALKMRVCRARRQLATALEKATDV